MQIIDPHLHLFDLERGEYGWLRHGNPPFWPDKSHICKDLDERDLSLTAPYSLAGFVHVEAGFDNLKPWREIDWLTDTVTLPFKAVAAISLDSPTFDDTLTQLKQRTAVVGVRDILDERAASILAKPECQFNLAKLAEHQLSFDAQLSAADNASFDMLLYTLKSHPQLVVVLNHAGWPPTKPSEYTRWLAHMATLAEFDNVAVKMSGWEMNDRHWQINDATKTVTDLLPVFGDKRLMLASNFPLSNWRHSYEDYWKVWTAALQRELGTSSCTQLISENARHWYKLALA